MKTIQHRCYAVLVIALIITTSCKKDSSTTTTTSAKLLTSAPWKQTKIEWQQTTTGVWIDEVAAGKAYVSPLPLTFFDNGSWSMNGGSYGTWTLSSDNTQLTMFGNNGTSATVTVSITSTTLQILSPLTNAYTTTNNPYTITYYSTQRDSYTH